MYHEKGWNTIYPDGSSELHPEVGRVGLPEGMSATQVPPPPAFPTAGDRPPTDFTVRPNRFVTALRSPLERPPVPANPCLHLLPPGILLGAAGYVSVDDSFHVQGWHAYSWCLLYLGALCFEMCFGKHIVSSVTMHVSGAAPAPGRRGFPRGV